MRRRRTAVVSTALLVAALCAAGVSVPAQAADGEEPPPAVVPTSAEEMAGEWTYDPQEQPAAGDVAARAAEEQVSEDVAAHRLRVDRAAGALEAEAERRWPDSFAGLWISRPDFTVRVAFTGDAAAKRDELARTFAFPEQLVAERAPVSLQDLRAIQERINTDRASQQQGAAAGPASLQATRGQYDTEIDVRTQTVVLRVPDQAVDGARAETPAAYGPRVRVQSGAAEPSGCSISDCRYAMLGGLELVIGSAGTCSSAFSATNGTNRFVLSAAHCYVNTKTTSRYNAGSYYGYTRTYQYSGRVDAERIIRSGSWRESGKFFVEGENPRLVEDYVGYGSTPIGAYLGKTGRSTGTTRGYVESKTVSPSYVPSSNDFLKVDFCVYPGDSGGAVWAGNSAYGIISGYYKGTSCRGGGPTGRGAGIYGAINFALASLDVSLLKNNLAPSTSFTSSCSVLMACSFSFTGEDEDGAISKYAWSFGDGTSSSARNPSHTYALPGEYTVRVTATDNNGASSSSTQTILVL